MTQLNPKTLAEIAERNSTTEAFFTYAACRERNIRNGVSKLPAIRAQMTKEGFSPIPQDLLTMFRELERAGAGELRGDTFKWAVPIKKIGETLSVPKPPHKRTPPPKEIKEVEKRSLAVCFNGGKEATVQFTPGLTREEVQFIADKLLESTKV